MSPVADYEVCIVVRLRREDPATRRNYLSTMAALLEYVTTLTSS